MKHTLLFLVTLFNCSLYGQKIDQQLLEKYDIEVVFRKKIQNNSFVVKNCDFCDELKVELFKSGIDVVDVIQENTYIIEVDFNSLSKGLKIIRGWNGKITNNDGELIGIFNVEKKKVVINSRQDYKDRKNCMLYIANEIYSNIK